MAVCLQASTRSRFAVCDGEASTLLVTPKLVVPKAPRLCLPGAPRPRLPGAFVLLPLADFPPQGEWWEVLGGGHLAGDRRNS